MTLPYPTPYVNLRYYREPLSDGRPVIEPLVFGTPTSDASLTPTSNSLSSLPPSPTPLCSIPSILFSPLHPSSQTPLSSAQPAATSVSPASSGPPDAELRAILSNAVAGPSGSWPYRFARDMAAGFMLLDQMGGTPRTRPQDFVTVFGSTYKSSTYNDNRTAWDRAHLSHGLDPQTVLAVDNKETWRAFRTQWK